VFHGWVAGGIRDQFGSVVDLDAEITLPALDLNILTRKFLKLLITYTLS
jgi:hypothetical protein